MAGKQTAGGRWPRRAKRASLVLGLAGVVCAALVAALWAWQLKQYKEPAPPLTRAELERSFAAAVAWMRANESRVTRSHNVMLWRMVRDAAEVSGDPFLRGMFDYYYSHHFRGQSWLVWDRLLNPKSQSLCDIRTFADVRPYQKLFVYGLTCDPYLASLEEIQGEQDRNLCWARGLRSLTVEPACSTHQLMGLALMRERPCGQTPAVAELMEHLKQDILLQLEWDFRVRDVYLQRVMVLYQNDAAHRVDPRWLRRVVEAQQPDGGWADQHPLFTLPGGRQVSLGGYGMGLVTLRQPRSGFHATAQGLLLTALALKASPRLMEANTAPAVVD